MMYTYNWAGSTGQRSQDIRSHMPDNCTTTFEHLKRDVNQKGQAVSSRRMHDDLSVLMVLPTTKLER
jgi:hypothetical protein